MAEKIKTLITEIKLDTPTFHPSFSNEFTLSSNSEALVDVRHNVEISVPSKI